MEYVFGTKTVGKTEVEILKTIGDVHSNLTGRQVVVREYPDQTIEDQFTIVRCYQSKVDSEGRHYDWYEIKDHFRNSDRFTYEKQTQVDSSLTKQRGDIDYMAMMLDVDLETEEEDE